MLNGVGIAKSLHQEAARFTQRAVDEFFREQLVPFVIDAGTAMEHLAKARVADCDPMSLYTAKPSTFSAPELRVVCGGGEPPPLWEVMVEIVGRLQNRRTIGCAAAIDYVFEGRASKDLITSAAGRVSDARNAAVHAGEGPMRAAVDSVAADWLTVMAALGDSRHPAGLWGYWANVADVQHLTLSRSLEADADVRLAQARERISGRGIDLARRSYIALATDEVTRCPVCGCAAVRSDLGGERFPVSLRDLSGEIGGVLDCLYCGLILYGPQISYALR